jgi:heme/copper-type cytochrome/quinol oxidase subunit 3
VAERRLAVRLFLLMGFLLAAAAALGLGLARWLPPRVGGGRTPLIPGAFVFSTALLGLCSLALLRAQASVRREQQSTFRRALLGALASGTAFVGVQGYGLWCIIEHLRGARNAGDAQLGATTLVLGAATLHALHVGVALLFLAYVTLQGLAGRYDHEYSFGVGVCGWFWHVLGMVWLFILAVYVLAWSFLSLPAGPL